jgi:hypothetical protein
MNKNCSRLITGLMLGLLLAGCLVNAPTAAPTPTAMPTPIISPVETPAASGEILRPLSKLSVHVGLKPQGLDDFLEVAQPAIVYSLNASVYPEIADHSPRTLLIRRIQNDTWSRLPDAMYQDFDNANWEAAARASARYEALVKTMYVPGRGRLNYMQLVALSQQDYVAPLNEPVLGQAFGDYALKARWLDAWFQEWLTIAHAHGIKGSIYSFPTGEPIVEAVPYLVGSARLAAQHGDLIDVHEYGIEGELMSSPSSGAFGFVNFYNALPVDARPLFVVSEFSAGNGYDTGLAGQRWISDAVAYGQRLRQYPYVIGAAAFQLDVGAESNIPPDVLGNYAEAAAAVDWTIYAYRLYLPIVLNLN